MSPSSARGLSSERRAALIRWTVIVLAALVGLIGSYFLVTAFVPRWWAQSVGRQVDGRLGRGIGLGMVYGLVFTAVPVLALAQVRRTSWRPSRRIGAGILAIALTAPNLITLGITLGTTDAAQAADALLEVQAPGFRPACLGGAITGVLLGAAIVVVSVLWSRRSQELATLRTRLAARQRS